MLVADGGINKQAMRYVVQSARAGGIPVFSDFSDSAHFDWVLETGLMQASDWLVLNDAALLSLLRTLRRTEVLSEWTRLLRSPSVTASSMLFVTNTMVRFSVCQMRSISSSMA